MVNPKTESTNADDHSKDLDSEQEVQNNSETTESASTSNFPLDSNGSKEQASDQISVNKSQSEPTNKSETAIPSAKGGNPMAEKVSASKLANDEKSAKPSSNVSPVYGNYENYQILPEAPWPPPIFIRQDISPQERYYIEHRWYSQWSYFDAKATENKNRYYRTQLIVVIGSVAVPVLVGITSPNQDVQRVLSMITVIISLSVAMSAALESLYTFGDNWRSYRSAAEDMHQEKSLYDVKAGRYSDAPQAFMRFVERCEEIIAQQNGRWIQSQEKAAEQTKDQGEEFLTSYGTTSIDQYGNKVDTITMQQFNAESAQDAYNGISSTEVSTVDPDTYDSSTPTAAG